MKDVLINFSDLDWDQSKKGVFQKVYAKGNNQMRLLRFDDTSKEENWCTNGHIGYVLEGEMHVDFDGILKVYKKGDGLWIEEGLHEKHRVFIKKNEFVELILFENAKT
jgi:quercetin dioxygenase-like cupin family protein